jgi:hypothetical protein
MVAPDGGTDWDCMTVSLACDGFSGACYLIIIPTVQCTKKEVV